MNAASAVARPGSLVGALAFGVLYGLGMGVAGVGGALLSRHRIETDLGVFLGHSAIATVIAGVLAAILAGWLGRNLFPTARVALALLALAILTGVAQHFVYFLDYASYYATFWERPFTIPWLRSVTATYAGSAFYFVSLGLPLMLPFGVPVVLGAALVLARPALKRSHGAVRPQASQPKGPVS